MLTHSAAPESVLLAADQFPHTYIDEMIPHQQGAIRMSRLVLASAEDPALRNLAETIIAGQGREIRRMLRFGAELGAAA